LTVYPGGGQVDDLPPGRKKQDEQMQDIVKKSNYEQKLKREASKFLQTRIPNQTGEKRA